MTRDELLRVCEGLDLRGNQVVVHASLSSLGHMHGGADAVCGALLEAVGDSGTVLKPAFTYAETLPCGGSKPTVYHPDLPVSREIGAVAEAFRRLPGALRSNHPTHSFAAAGRQARNLLSTQRDNNPLGPLKKLNVGQGFVLMLGTSLHAATAIHLAEEHLGLSSPSRRTALRLNAAGYAERVVLENLPGCSAGFDKLEARLDPSKLRATALPRGSARKIPIRQLVQLAIGVLEVDPLALLCNRPECTDCIARRDTAGGRRSATG